MTESILREITVPQSPAEVWQAITDSATLGEWLMPNDFAPRVGHRFTFRMVPSPNPEWDGIVHCEVLECEPTTKLAYSWSGGGLETRVTYRLEPVDSGTRLHFEHSGFDLTLPRYQGFYKGAEFGWTKMLGDLERILSGAPVQSN